MSNRFIIGQRYFDRKGAYTVIEIRDGKVKFKYDDGQVNVGDITVKSRIHSNILAEQKSQHPYQSHSYFKTLGFLARRAEFHAEVPPKSQSGFEDRYLKLVGKRPVLHKDKYFPIEVVKDDDKWAAELRIYLPETEGLDFPSDVELRSGHSSGILRINNNEFWWRLIGLGFRLGTGHAVQLIKSNIPAAFAADFEAGMSYKN